MTLTRPVCTGIRLLSRAAGWFLARPYLMLVTALALLLRLSMILWGLPGGPDGAFHADESKYLDPAIKFLRFYLTDRPFPLYGTSLQYTIGPILAPLDVLVWLTGNEQPYRMLATLFCRFTVVLLGALAVPLLYRLAEDVLDRRTAMIAATLMAVTPFHVLNSAYFTADVPMATLLLLNLLLLHRLQKAGGSRRYAAAGAAFGYMLGMKLVAVVYLIVPISAYFFRRRRLTAPPFSRIAIYLGAAILTFAVLNPQFFLGLDKLIERVAMDKTDFWDRTAPGSIALAALEQWDGYARGLGLPILLTALLGLCVGLRRAAAFKLSLLSMLLVYGLYFGHFMLARYAIFVAPIFCILSASFLATLLTRRQALARTGGVLLLIVVLATTSLIAVAGIASRLSDPRIEAARYIAATYEPGTSFGFGIESEEHEDTHPWRFPALYRSDHRRLSVLESPDVILTSSAVMRRINKALDSEHLSERYEWSPEANDWWHRYSPPSPALFALYAELRREERYRLVETFRVPVPDELVAEFVIREIGVYERISL